MNDPARATCHYIDHDGLIQTKAAKGSSDLQASFGIAMADGSTRIYARAGEIGGADEVTYSVHESGAVKVSWPKSHSEWLAPGSWHLIRDSFSVDHLLNSL
ncbi:MAG: hypothetical protein ACOH1Y_18320 [Propionicimonas sp.]